MIKYFIFFIALIAIFMTANASWQGENFMVYPLENGSINYYRPVTFIGVFPGQNRFQGWRNFGAETFDIFTTEYCKTIYISTGSYDMFIPTKTEAEWLAFKNANHPRVTISACSSGAGCDIFSGEVCGSTCPPGMLCQGFPSTYSNECEAFLNHAHSITLGACAGGGGGGDV